LGTKRAPLRYLIKNCLVVEEEIITVEGECK